MNRALLIHPGITAHSHLDRPQPILLTSDDRARWERLVADDPGGHVLQCWAWGELKRAFGWNPLRIALWDTAGDRLVAGAQVLLRPIPWTGSLLAYIPRGPMLNWADASLCQTFFAALHAFLRARKVAVLRMEPAVPESIGPSSFQQGKHLITPPAAPLTAYFGGLYGAVSGHTLVQHLTRMGFRRTQDRVQLLRTIAIDLTPDEQVIRHRQKPKWRYNAGLAASKGVTIRPAQSLEEVERWYELMEITRKRNRFAGHPFSYYQRAWELLGAVHQGHLLLAEYAGKLLAGAFITLVGQQSIYLYGASGNERRNLMPNHLLQWEAMRWAKAQGATLYDLWGIADSDDPAHPEAGLSGFKRGWGGQVITYIGTFDYVYAPTPYLCFRGGRAIRQQVTALRASLRRRGYF